MIIVNIKDEKFINVVGISMKNLFEYTNTKLTGAFVYSSNEQLEEIRYKSGYCFLSWNKKTGDIITHDITNLKNIISNNSSITKHIKTILSKKRSVETNLEYSIKDNKISFIPYAFVKCEIDLESGNAIWYVYSYKGIKTKYNFIEQTELDKLLLTLKEDLVDPEFIKKLKKIMINTSSVKDALASNMEVTSQTEYALMAQSKKIVKAFLEHNKSGLTENSKKYLAMIDYAKKCLKTSLKKSTGSGPLNYLYHMRKRICEAIKKDQLKDFSIELFLFTRKEESNSRIYYSAQNQAEKIFNTYIAFRKIAFKLQTMPTFQQYKHKQIAKIRKFLVEKINTHSIPKDGTINYLYHFGIFACKFIEEGNIQNINEKSLNMIFKQFVNQNSVHAKKVTGYTPGMSFK